MNADSLGDTAAWAGMAMLGKSALALLVIIAVILVCGYLLKLVNPQRALQGQRLRVVASTAVGQRERVVIVEVESTWLVLGVASGQVTRLHELPAPSSPPTADTTQGSFASRLGQYLEQAKTRHDGDGNVS